jgi:hypothetical protein
MCLNCAVANSKDWKSMLKILAFDVFPVVYFNIHLLEQALCHKMRVSARFVAGIITIFSNTWFLFSGGDFLDFNRYSF